MFKMCVPFNEILVWKCCALCVKYPADLWYANYLNALRSDCDDMN